MKRLMMALCITMLTLAFAGAAMACPVLGGTGWYIKRNGGIEHLFVDVNGKKTDTKYSTYVAQEYKDKKLVKEYKAYALNPSYDQNHKKGHTLVNGVDYFAAIGKTAEYAEIQRHFQISHYIQANNKLENRDMLVYQKYLMLSVWEVMTDGAGNFDLFSGALKLNDKEKKEFAWFKATQDHYTAIFASNDYKEHHYDFSVLVSTKSNKYLYADMLIFEYDVRTPPVPIPGAVWLMGTGVAGLAALRRKRAQK